VAGGFGVFGSQVTRRLGEVSVGVKYGQSRFLATVVRDA